MPLAASVPMALLVLLSVMVLPPNKSRLPALTKPVPEMLLELPPLSVMVLVPVAVKPALIMRLPP